MSVASVHVPFYGCLRELIAETLAELQLNDPLTAKGTPALQPMFVISTLLPVRQHFIPRAISPCSLTDDPATLYFIKGPFTWKFTASGRGDESCKRWQGGRHHKTAFCSR